MSDRPKPDPATGWGEALPLALTPIAPAEPTRTGGNSDADADRDGRAAVGAEIGGPKGPEPTRYNDWERNGRCTDF